MGIGSLGISELVVIFIIVLVFFGPRRFPEIARSMGHAMREFRRSLNQIQRELEDADPRSSIPGRDIMKDLRSGGPGKWWDPNASSTGSSATDKTAAPPAPATTDPQVTGEAGGEPGVGPTPGPDDAIPADGGATDPAEQLPMFGTETEDTGSSEAPALDAPPPGRPPEADPTTDDRRAD
jgi:sec-independent protein translocase protein TatA